MMNKKVITPRRFTATGLALALATISVLATAQLPDPLKSGSPKLVSAGQVSPLSAALPDEPSLNRLIIKFKKSSTTLAGVFDHRAAEDRVAALSAGNRKAAPMAAGMTRIKSITTHTDVAVLNKNHNRTDLRAFAKQLEQDPAVEYVEIDERVFPLLTPADPDYAGKQWHLQEPVAINPGGANLPLAWDLNTGTGVVVAVIDTGFRPHTDLNANLLPGYDFVTYATANTNGGGLGSDGSDPGDWTTAGLCGTNSTASNSSWHGTHVAGTVAASSNTVGGVGVAYKAKILPVRVIGSCGGFLSDTAAGMRWAAGLAVPNVPTNVNPAKVLNLSLGGSGTCSQFMQDAVNAVRDAGTAVVAATGNDRSTRIGTPANCAGVIGVTAHTRLGDNANYADIGPGTAISGPGGGSGTVVAGAGEKIYSTLNTGLTVPVADSFGLKQGTSMAAPHVAAVLALLKSYTPGLTPDQLQSVVSNSARPFPAGTFCVGRPECGTGMLDARRALDRLIAGEPFSTASAGPGLSTATRLPGSTVTLTGQATPAAAGSNSFTYLWRQLSGAQVAISQSTSASASFVAPSAGGNLWFEFRATDNTGKFTVSQLSVTTNTPPILSAIPSQSVLAGGALSFTVSATDADNDPVAYLASGLPAGATFNGTTGVFTWNSAGPAGNYVVTVASTDGKNSGTSQTASISVTEPVAVANSSSPSGGGGGGATGLWDLLGMLALGAVALFTRQRHAAKK